MIDHKTLCVLAVMLHGHVSKSCALVGRAIAVLNSTDAELLETAFEQEHFWLSVTQYHPLDPLAPRA